MIKSTHENLKQQNYFLEVEAEAQEARQGLRWAFSQEFPEGNEEASIDEEPWFPDLEWANNNNRDALIEHGQESQAGIGALRPDVLESALGRAQNYHYYEDDLLKAAAALAHGIGQSQAFEDGNKRTAYHTARQFLDANGYGHVSPEHIDDEDLADHLIGYGEGTHSMEDTALMFQQRHNDWLAQQQ